MSGSTIERGIPNQTESQKPAERPFIVSSQPFSAVNFEDGVKGYFRLTKLGPEIIDFEILVTDKERLAIVRDLHLSTSFQLINARLDLRAARSVTGADTGDNEMTVLDLRSKFDDNVKELYSLHETEIDIANDVSEAAKLISRGETRMATKPMQVRIEEDRLLRRVKKLKPQSPDSIT